MKRMLIAFVPMICLLLVGIPTLRGADLLSELGEVRAYAHKCLTERDPKPDVMRTAPQSTKRSASQQRGSVKKHQSRVVRLLYAAAKKHGIDPKLAVAVAEVESGMNQSAVSPKGARGVMQIMPQTAKELSVDAWDVEENIDGGVRYLRQLTDEFGLRKGLAAYNFGPNNIRAQKPWPRETREYVKKVIKRFRITRG